MHSGKKFTIKETLIWTFKEIIIFAFIGAIPAFIYIVLDIKSIAIPWLPIALVGTAVAFITGFKNNASYDRLWEARKIWGAIVNTSRAWGMVSIDYVTNKHAESKLSDIDLKKIHQRLIYRHIAWLTALRYQLRQPKIWEYSHTHKASTKYREATFQVEEFNTPFEEILPPFLSKEEEKYILGKKNRATHLLKLQSKDLKELLDKGYIEDFRHMEMENLLIELFNHQGKSERIKNFPYPRQYTTINSIFIWIFIILIPFGMIQEFEKIGEHSVWLTIPFTTICAWVFHTIDRIGTSSENPFEGAASDVPITSLSRTIEIDLREMLDEENLPAPTPTHNNILM